MKGGGAVGGEAGPDVRGAPMPGPLAQPASLFEHPGQGEAAASSLDNLPWLPMTLP